VQDEEYNNSEMSYTICEGKCGMRNTISVRITMAGPIVLIGHGK